MIIYNYDPHTLVYTGISEADESPLEPGVFLVPRYATIATPLAEKFGFNIIYQNNNWEYQQIIEPVEDIETINNQKLLEIELLAKSSLFNSDWVLLPDVQLINKAEWLDYRAKLRTIAINPILNADIPEKPEVLWS